MFKKISFLTILLIGLFLFSGCNLSWSQDKTSEISGLRDSAQEKYGLEDYQGAIQDYNKVIELDPENVDAYHNRGLAKSDLGDLEGAIQDYNKAIKLDPEASLTYYNLAWENYKLKNYEQAIQSFTKVIELDPGMIEASNFRWLSYINIWKTSEGCIDLQTALNWWFTDATSTIEQYCK